MGVFGVWGLVIPLGCVLLWKYGGDFGKEWLAVAAIILLLTSFLKPTAATRRVDYRTGINIKQILLALHNYHDDHGSLPPAYTVDSVGNRLHSWRTLILPYVEQSTLSKKIRYDEPWNSPHNRAVAGKHRVEVYRCDKASPKFKGGTNYFAVLGPNAAWTGERSRKLGDIDVDSTILIVESHGHDIHWMEPRDLSPSMVREIIRENTPHHRFGPDNLFSSAPGSFPIGIADGSVFPMTQRVTSSDLDKLLDIRGELDLQTRMPLPKLRVNRVVALFALGVLVLIPFVRWFFALSRETVEPEPAGANSDSS